MSNVRVHATLTGIDNGDLGQITRTDYEALYALEVRAGRRRLTRDYTTGRLVSVGSYSVTHLHACYHETVTGRG